MPYPDTSTVRLSSSAACASCVHFLLSLTDLALSQWSFLSFLFIFLSFFSCSLFLWLCFVLSLSKYPLALPRDLLAMCCSGLLRVALVRIQIRALRSLSGQARAHVLILRRRGAVIATLQVVRLAVCKRLVPRRRVVEKQALSLRGDITLRLRVR